MKYNVTLVRVGYSYSTVTVDAESKREAEKLAMDKAGTCGWNEADAEFYADDVEEADEDD